MNQLMQKFGVGASALRKEDDSFLRGKGRYTDDIHIEGCLRGFVVRSPIANGGFKIGSLKEAKAAPGVRLVLTGKDVAHLGALQCFRKPKGGVARDIPILCAREVSHVGDAVAFIVADTLFEAQSAAELIDIDWQPRPAIASTAKALDKGAPLRRERPQIQSRLYRALRQPGQNRARLRQGRACHPHRLSQQPPGAELSGNPRRHRRMERRGEPLCSDLRDAGRAQCAQESGGESLPHSKEAAARRDAGCRRRVRAEGHDLPRICAGAGGGQAAWPAGQMDMRARRAFPVGRAGARQCRRSRNGDGQGRPVPRPARNDHRQSRRLHA